MKWSGPLRGFALFVLFTLAVEVFAIFWKWELSKTVYWDYSRSNLWVYNAFTVVRYLFFLWFFHGILTSPVIRRTIRWSSLPFGLLAVSNYFFIQTPHQVNTYTIVLANTVTVLLVLAYFNQILKDRVIIRLHASPEVWICLGTMIYYSATLPFFIFFNYLITTHASVLRSYLVINDALNLVMYTLYLIAFLCKTPSQK
jgi:hypothetical protein